MSAKRLLTGLCALTTLLGVPLAVGSCPRPGEAFLAVIVDDRGYSRERGKALAVLPVPLTLSILPQTPYAAELAQLGASWGKEIMVHLPMSSMEPEDSEPLHSRLEQRARGKRRQ